MQHATVRLSHPRIELGRHTTMFARIDLTGPARAAKAPRPPINICLVIDRSGSMDGERLDNARRAARMIVDRLGPNDRVSVVAFDDDVDVVVSTRAVDDRLVIGERIERIRSGGSTNVSGALLAGMQQLRAGHLEGGVNRLVLLSDGYANVGETDAARLGALAGELRAGCTIATIGIGGDYDDQLLGAIAEAGDGDMTHAAGADDIAGAVAAHREDLASITAQNAWISLDADACVEVTGVLGRDMYAWPLPVGDLYEDVPRSVIVRLQVRPGEAAAGELELGTLRVGMTSLDDPSREHVERVPLAVIVTEDAGQVAAGVDTDVLAAAHLQLAAIAIGDATRMAGAGQHEDARDLLRRTADEAEADGAADASRVSRRMLDRIDAEEVDEHLSRRSASAYTRSRRSSASMHRPIADASMPAPTWLDEALQLDDPSGTDADNKGT